MEGEQQALKSILEGGDNLVFKIHFFSVLVNRIYELNGFSGNPFTDWESQQMLEVCYDDLMELFNIIFENEVEAIIAMNQFWQTNGVVMLFYVLLDPSLKQKLLGCKWPDVQPLMKMG